MKRAAIILLMAVFLLVGCGTQPESEPETDIVDTGETITAENTEDPLGTGEVSNVGASTTYHDLVSTELISESNAGNTYKLTFNSLDPCYITLEPNMFFETSSVIYDDVLVEYYGDYINRKVGEIAPAIEFGSGEKASDFFDNEEYDGSYVYEEVVVQSDSYTNSTGKTIYYSIVKSGLDDAPGYVWRYTYLVPLSDNIYAYIFLRAHQDNRSADEPRFRAIADSIVPAS